MHNKIKFKHKLDLLLISIEALSLYISKNIYNKTIDSTKLYQHIFFIRSGNYIRNTNGNLLFNLHQTITIIYQIYLYSKQIYLQEIVKKVLNNYCNSIDNTIEVQYYNRFQYIYRKTQNYYSHYSYYKHIKTEQLAILNLYIINKINNNYGFYFLIKYLLRP